MITKEMGLVDFSKTADEIDCQIRAFTPWPSAYFYIDNVRCKIISAKVSEACNHPIGTVVDNKGRLSVACKDNTTIDILKIQPEGKGVMDVKSYLNGKPISVGTML